MKQVTLQSYTRMYGPLRFVSVDIPDESSGIYLLRYLFRDNLSKSRLRIDMDTKLILDDPYEEQCLGNIIRHDTDLIWFAIVNAKYIQGITI